MSAGAVGAGATRIGLLVNRKSRRNRAGAAALQEGLSDPRLATVGVGHIDELPDALRRLAGEGIDVLAISGGDGTVQAVLTELFNGGAFPTPPDLAILAGGTTNVIAADVGVVGRPERALARLLARTAGDVRPATVERDVIRLTYRPDRRPIYGMLFGTAAICRAMVFCRSSVESIGLTAGPASAVTLARLLGGKLFGRARSDAVLHGDEMTVRLDGGADIPGRRLLALATTLDRLMMGARPFWGIGQGSLRYSEIGDPPVRLLRSAGAFLYGRASRLPADVYRSRNADRVVLEMACPFTLDGELYEPVAGIPVELVGGGRVRFVRC